MTATENSFAAGVVLYERADYAAAASCFARLADRDPRNPDVVRLHGLSLLRAGHPAEALPRLARAVNLAPENPLAHLHHGVGLLEIGRYARAAARLRRAVTLDPASPAGWINFSSALLAVGQAPAARAAARRALSLSPDLPDALHALARGHAAAGDMQAARAGFETLLARQPARLEAWIDLGEILFRTGNMRLGREAMHRALALNPQDSRAAANMAALSVVTGDIEAGLSSLKDIVAADPLCAPARLNLANALLLEREAGAALAALSGQAPPGREGRHWLAHRALALMLVGRPDAARDALDAIAQPYGDAAILVASRRMHLARLTGDWPSCEYFAAQLETFIADEAAFLFEHRVMAAFDLARMRGEQGQREAAFALWQLGHRLMRRVQPFSRENFTAFVNASIGMFARVAPHPEQSAGAENPVFIVGLPRSGTTLTEHVLAAHAQVHGAGERKAVHELITALAGPPLQARSVRTLAALSAAALDAARRGFLAALAAEAPGARYVIDKMPANALHLGFLAGLLPDAKFILTRRDLRDTGLSIFQHRFFGYHPYAHDLGDLGFYMREHERLITHWRHVLAGRLIEVALDDWVSDFPGTLARLERFLGLPHDPACESFHQSRRHVRTASAAQVRQPINASGIGRWRAYRENLAPMIAALEDTQAATPPNF